MTALTITIMIECIALAALIESAMRLASMRTKLCLANIPTTNKYTHQRAASSVLGFSTSSRSF